MRKRGSDFRGGKKGKASASPVPFLVAKHTTKRSSGPFLVVCGKGLRLTPKTSTIYYYGRIKNIIKRQFE